MSPKRRSVSFLLLLTLAVPLAGCGPSSVDEPRPVVGFIFVGARDDLGYNQAAWEASESLARAYPDVEILRVEDVPEDDRAVEVLEGLIDRGAGLLVATSFGHRDAAVEVARSHPDVVVAHQGGRPPAVPLANFGTFFATHHEILFAAGIAAAHDARDGRLGYVIAFPIPAAYANVDAFLLGARTVRPDAVVDVVLTEHWCDPDAQRVAFDALLANGMEVLAMHQDCTETLLHAAESAGIGVVGYHLDGSEVAPRSWLVGSVWTWAEVYGDITEAFLQDRFATSPYVHGQIGTLATQDNPASLAEAGDRVPPAVAQQLDGVLADVARGAVHPFEGPVVDVDGRVRIPAGERPDQDEIELMDYFVDGVRVLDVDVGG